MPTLAMLLVMLAASLRGQTTNGGFEMPGKVYPYRVFGVGTSLPGWTVERGTVEIVSGRYWQPAEGNQSLDLNGIFDQIGTIYQDIATKPGQRYRVRFAFSGNPEGGWPKMKSFRVDWDGQAVTTLSFDTTGQTNSNMGWRHHEFVVTASGATSRLRFESLTPTFCGPVLDDITVTPVSDATPTLREQLQAKQAATAIPGTTTAPSPAHLTISTTPAATLPAAASTTPEYPPSPVLTLFGTIGAEYRIEVSQDLRAQEWQSLALITLVENPQIWVDYPMTNFPQRFYRAVATGK
jgi:choice-of-anchor C domain-containing protein